MPDFVDYASLSASSTASESLNATKDGASLRSQKLRLFTPGIVNQLHQRFSDGVSPRVRGKHGSRGSHWRESSELGFCPGHAEGFVQKNKNIYARGDLPAFRLCPSQAPDGLAGPRRPWQILICGPNNYLLRVPTDSWSHHE
jgi:hypothetical protein